MGKQGGALVLLRTLIGWHFLYEGYFKLALPGWAREGHPLGAWSAASYLKGAAGPLAGFFQSMSSPVLSPWIDRLVPIGLTLVGLSLVLGLLTQAGCWGALAFLSLFYASAIPMDGIPQPHAEGTYLIVNKNLIEWSAVLVLLLHRTGEIAGLDLLRRRTLSPAEAIASAPSAETATSH
jgi:thiosulfate dehydrogenase [quinone] large subunit